MANESEGVLDVLREWRDMVCYSKGPAHPLCHGAIMHTLDRIEAAWTREREALEAHVRSLQSQLKVAYSCGEQPQGNAAVMYKALLIVKKLFDGRIMFQPAIRDAHKAVNDALSTPPRNCDVFNDWKIASIMVSAHCLHVSGDTIGYWLAMQVSRWLLDCANMYGGEVVR